MPEPGLQHRDLTEQIIGVFYGVFDVLGHGFVESIYEEAMVVDLRGVGLSVERQVPVIVHFRGHSIGTFKADIIVNQCVVLELKASRAISGAHEAQLLNYLRATEMEVGLIFNFGPRPTFKRLVFANERKVTARL